MKNPTHTCYPQPGLAKQSPARRKHSRALRRLVYTPAALVALLAAQNAKCTILYFDPNGANPVTSGTYTWDTSTAQWSTSSALTGTLVVWNSADAACFCAGSFTGNITVVVNSAINCAGFFDGNEKPPGCNLTFTGSGSLNFASGAQALGVGGSDGNTVTMNIPITGSGAEPETEMDAVNTLNLNVNNSTTGGWILGPSSSGPGVNINNGLTTPFGSGTIANSSTATRQINIQSGQPAATIPNAWTLWAGTLLIVDGAANNLTLSGAMALPASGSTATIQLAPTTPSSGLSTLTISGAISGAGNLNFTGTNGAVFLTGANTFTGPITSTVGTLTIGGAGKLKGGLYSAAISDGGILNYASSAQQELSGVISGPGSLVVSGSGELILAGANTYTGGTTVSSGTLEITGTGSIPGNIAVNGGTLILQNATALSSPTTATMSLSNGVTVNLSFTGTQTINLLTSNGVALAGGTWGASGSGAQHTSPLFAGSGVLNVSSVPDITGQPASQSVWQGSSVTFSVTALAATTYQWQFNGTNISGATTSSYSTNPVALWSAGDYTCVVGNSSGYSTSSPAWLAVRSTNAYTSIVLSDTPLAYWRLDELGGTNCFDASGNHNNGTYMNNGGVFLDQTPGYSTIDTDPCAGITATGGNNYMLTSSFFNFFTNSRPNFTLEAWAYFTNLSTSTSVERIFDCGSYISGQVGGYMFGIGGYNQLRFTTAGNSDFDLNLAAPLQNNVWYQLAVGCDGTTLHFYVNGQPVGTILLTAGSGTSGVGVAETVPMQLGCDPDTIAGREQFVGRLDECSIYGTFLGDSEIQNHYNAALPAAPVASAPVADFPTNYVTETTTFTENAVGQNLMYQWYVISGGVTNPASGQNGGNNSTLVLSDLQPNNAGSYYCNVSNNGGSTNTPAVALVVLPIPTNAAQLDSQLSSLPSGLVLHLPFDSNYNDVSGRNNNGTAVGSPSINTANPAPAVGGGCLYFESDSGTPSYNYVTLGQPTDLLFSNSVNFTIAFWVQQNFNGSISTNLPFFDNTVGSFGAADGWCLAPGYTGGNPNGAWDWSAGDGVHAATGVGAPSSIGDGNWHHLAFVFNRTGNEATYVDGQFASSKPVFAVTNMDTANVINIAQDATGQYAASGTTSGYMDDLGVWRRALSPLEVEGIYLAGSQNSPGVSFANPVVGVTDTPVTITNITPTTLSYSGGSGAQFILMTTNVCVAPSPNWQPLATNPATPGTFTISATNTAAFFYIQSK